MSINQTTSNLRGLFSSKTDVLRFFGDKKGVHLKPNCRRITASFCALVKPERQCRLGALQKLIKGARVVLGMFTGSVPGPSEKTLVIGVTDNIEKVALMAFIRSEIYSN